MTSVDVIALVLVLCLIYGIGFIVFGVYTIIEMYFTDRRN